MNATRIDDSDQCSDRGVGQNTIYDLGCRQNRHEWFAMSRHTPYRTRNFRIAAMTAARLRGVASSGGNLPNYLSEK
jgi:hypothetical protein